MHFSTNHYGNIHMPRLGPAEDAPGKAPNPSIIEARCDLLATHGLQIPGRGATGSAVLYKFIDGERLSRKDSLELSRWLDGAAPQRKAELLAAMQELQRSFVPTLNLTRSGQAAQEVINLLTDLHDSGVEFGVSATETLPKSIAIKLKGVMESPQSRVTSFDYPCASISDQVEASTIRAILSDSITQCTTLERVSGFPPVLSLLRSSIPEIALTVLVPPTVEQEQELRRVLSLGEVEKFFLRSDLGAAHLWVANTVAEVNATLLPERSVRRVELNTYADRINYEHVGKVVSRLFSARHLTDVTLPNPQWIDLLTFRSQSREGSWREPLLALPSLQSLSFNTPYGLEREGQADVDFNAAMDLLGVVLQRNKQSLLLATTGAGLGFALTMMGSEIDPLAKHLGEAFAGTSTGRALTEVTTYTAAGARAGRGAAEKQYQKNRAQADLNYENKLRDRHRDHVLSPSASKV